MQLSENETKVLSEHTPGPWKVNLRRGTINGAEIVNDSAELIVKMPNRADRRVDQKRADARLIAAAPDMLALLKRALGDAEHVLSQKFWDDVRAVIAKAEGAALSSAQREGK